MKRLLSLTILILAFSLFSFAAPGPVVDGPGALQFSSATYSLPEGGNSTIFPVGSTPTNSNPNNLQLQLGVKFRSDVSGYITGIRFYKGPTDTSLHSGSLWSAAGALLATGTFTNETATGWQQLNFATPVAIAANTTYIASYFTMTSFFVDLNYFTSQGANNAPLHGLQNGVDGPNGVYRYGPGGVVPSDTYFSSNYWVDVVFSPTQLVTITRTGGSTGAVGASFTTSNGSATAGSDYTSVSQIVTFADGDTADKVIQIPVLDDAAIEGNETVNLALTSPTGGATLGSPSTAVLTIVDNESAPAGSLQFSAATYSVNENGTNATITITRTGGSFGAVGASFATSNGTATSGAGNDYTAVSQLVSWANGDTASKTVSIPILDDAAAEANETVNLALTAPTGGATLGSPNTAVLTIIDNESPIGTLQFSSAAYSVPENAAISAFGPTALPSNSSANNIPLELGVKIRSDVSGFITGIRFYKLPADTSAHTGSLWSAAGALLATGTFTNETASGWQQLNFDTPAPIAANTTYTASFNTSGPFYYDLSYFQSTGANNAPLHALQNGVDGPNGVYRYGSGTFPTDSYFSSNYWVDVAYTPNISALVTVVRTGGSAGAVGATVATSNGTATAGSDYAALSRTVSFANGEVSKTVVITIIDDVLTEGNETVNFALSNPTGGATLGSPSAAVLTITDNEAPSAGSIQFNAAAYSQNENAGSKAITITRTGGSAGAVSAQFTTSNGTATSGAGNDYTAVSGTVNFGAGDTADKFINVVILDDAVAEGNETVNLALTAPTGGATLGSPNTAVLTILDNESAPASVLQFSSATYSLRENYSRDLFSFAPNTGPQQSLENSSPVELGVKFRSDVAGFITGIRFYKGPTDTSVHTASLWSGGVLIATGTFTNETATGWQQLNFVSPVAIAANTTYIASYHTSSSFFYNLNYFTNQGVDNAPLHALQDGVDGPNGVYRYGSGGVVPTDSYQSSNYWVEVAFSTSVSAFVTVTRTGGSTGAVGATVATSNGTATAGPDYAAVSRTVSFADGDTAPKAIAITLYDDAVLENSETVNFTLSNPTGGAALGSPNPAVLTIIDNSTLVTNCSHLHFRTPGAYRLANDCTIGAGIHPIEVETNNVTFDLDGHTISGPLTAGNCTPNSGGIEIPGRTNIVIANGTITGFKQAIVMSDGHHNTLHHLTLTGNCDGLTVDDSSDNDFYNITATENLENGVIFDHANRNKFRDSTVTLNGEAGEGAGVVFESAGENVVTTNTVSGNGQYGVVLDGVVGYSISNTFQGNTAQTNGEFDFADLVNTNPCVNTWTGNTFTTDNESGGAAGPAAGCIK